MHRLRSLPCALAAAILFFRMNVAKIRIFSSKFLRLKAAGDAAATAGASAEIVRLREDHNPDGLDGTPLAGVAVGGTSGLLPLSEAGSVVSADVSAGGAAATAGASAKFAEAAVGGNSGLPTVPELGDAVFAGASMPEARVAVTAGDSAGNINLPLFVESARSSLCHRSSLARSCADGDGSCAVVASVSVSAASGVAALPVPFTHVCSCCECMWRGGKRLQFVVGHGT